MVAAYQYPSSQNTFVKSHEATNKLVVDFSRNPKDFGVTRYTQIVPVDKTAGYYMRMTLEEAARVLNSDVSEHYWPDNEESPQGLSGTESFRWEEFRAKRYAYAFRLGDRTVDVSSWDIVAQHGAIKAQQAMTARTVLAIAELQNSSNYAAAHTSAVSAITGNTGTWAESTTARQDIRRSLNYAANVIRKATFAVVKPKDLMLVITPETAKELAECQEIVDFIKGSPAAWASINGNLADQNNNVGYGLPPDLYGYELVIEDAVKVTSHKAATKTDDWVMDGAKPFLCARPGGLTGTYGAPSFSTCTIFMKEEMTTETLRDPNHRLTRGRVTEDFDVVMTAPISGFLFTSAI